MSIYKPLRIRVLSRPEEISAYVHPARMRILALLAEAPATLTMTARSLATRPANLSHHFRRLEAAGLIVLAETRTTSKNIEKYYRAAARSFILGTEDAAPSDKAALGLSILREELGNAAGRARKGNAGEHLVLLSSARIPRVLRDEFRERLQDLVREFGAKDDPAGEPYTLAAALFPAADADIGGQKVRLGGSVPAKSEGVRS